MNDGISNDNHFSDDIHLSHIFKRNRALSDFKAKHRKISPRELRVKKFSQWYNDDNEYYDRDDLLNILFPSSYEFSQK